MKNYRNTAFYFFFLLFVIIISLTFLQSYKQDFTSIIDFDLTVIHNSLQLVSNEYPDFTYHTAYSQFLLTGITYKLVQIFDQNLITNIKLLTNFENPEIVLQKLYIIARVLNSTLLFITLIFLFKIFGKFKIKNYLKYLFIITITLTETFWSNFTVLRADVVSICFYWISFYFLINFIKNKKIINLFFVSFFMVFSLLAKVQIIFLFMFMYFFFIFYFVNEKENIKTLDYSNIFFKSINVNYSYIILSILITYFLFQFYLNNFVNSSTPIGYFDAFLFAIYFLIMYLTIFFMGKRITNKNYLYEVFTIILFFSTLVIIFIKFLNIIDILQIDFNIILSITNPFYFLKSYSTFIDNEFSLIVFFEMFSLLISYPKVELVYLFILSIILFTCIYKLVLEKKKINYNYIYIILFCLITFFLIALNNFRFLIIYNLYLIPIFFLLSGIFLSTLKRRAIFVCSSLFFLFLSVNMFMKINNYKIYVFKESNMEHVCKNNIPVSSIPIRNFYNMWAKNFNEEFFKKICLNKNFIFM